MSDYTLDTMRAYSIAENGLEGRVKSPIIYGHWGSTISPLAYIQKPKWVSDDDFKRVVKAINLHLVTAQTEQKEELDDILERLQLFAKDHPVDMTNGDIKDRENAKQAIKDLMLDIVGEDEPEEVSGEQE